MYNAVETKQINVGIIIINGTQKVVSVDSATEKQIKTALRFVKLTEMQQDDFKARNKFNSIHGDISSKRWKQIYLLPHLCKIDNFTRDIQYKILHRFLPSNKLIYKMKIVASHMCPSVQCILRT